MILLIVILVLLKLVNSDIETSHTSTAHVFPFDTKNNSFQYDCPDNSSYCIFKPFILYHQKLAVEPKVLLSAENWVDNIKSRVIDTNRLLKEPIDPLQKARDSYLQVLSSFVTGLIYGNAEKAVGPGLQISKHNLHDMLLANRESGLDWAYLGITMTGKKRIETIEVLLKEIFRRNISGDFIETGVWRGGSSIFARGVMRGYNEGHRLIYACDSFAGLPPGHADIFGKGDMNWNNSPYLEVNSFTVANNFHSVSMLDPNVVFVQGYFNNSIPNLRRQVGKISLLRLDGDIYESTVDVLYHLYDKVEVGGFIIIDDWNKDDNNPPTPFPAKVACLDFFKVHNINVDIITIDYMAVYWQKTENVEVQYWRYEKKQFT